ncbi:MAG: hypothetical protein MUF54_01615 [Polyangiaceae bacterium]|nr:hypothetical protein [Polyangiaceae bacterium]
MHPTCRGARSQVDKLLGYLEQRGIDLGAVKAEYVETHFDHSHKRWGLPGATVTPKAWLTKLTVAPIPDSTSTRIGFHWPR